MSKMDDLRAMREAHFAKVAPRTSRPGAAAAPVAPAPAKRARAAAAPAEAATAGVTTDPDALCGHRAISGRTCTREAGHAAKNHRYS